MEPVVYVTEFPRLWLLHAYLDFLGVWTTTERATYSAHLFEAGRLDNENGRSKKYRTLSPFSFLRHLLRRRPNTPIMWLGEVISSPGSSWYRSQSDCFLNLNLFGHAPGI